MSPKIIYLDQNIWIYLARAYYGINKDVKIKRICEKVIKTSESNSSIFPLSINHLFESHHKLDLGKRDKLIDFMSKVSKGYTIPTFTSVIETEIKNATLKKLGYRTINKRDFEIKGGFSNMFGATGTIQGNIPEDLKNLMIEWINSPEAFTLLAKSHKIFDKDDSFIEAIERIEKERSTYTRIKDPKIRDKVILAENIKAILYPTIIKICYELGIYNFFKGWNEKELMDFIKEIPTFYVLFNLSYQNEKNYNRPIKRNDIYDISSLSIAIPYCDIVVTEKHFASITKSVKLDKIYNTIILCWSSIDELEKHL